MDSRTTKSRFAVAFIALALLTVTAPAQKGDATEEASVRALVAHEIEGWNKFDAKQIVSCFTTDAIWQNPFGVRIHGSDQLERFLNNLFGRPGYRSASDSTAPKILDVRRESDTVWTVWSDESSKGQIDDATGKPMAPRHSFYMEVVVKTPSGFKISESMIMDIKEP